MPHPVIHAEIRSEDPDATRAFFAELFGWKVSSDRGFPGYTFIDTGADSGPGGRAGPPGRRGGEQESRTAAGARHWASAAAARRARTSRDRDELETS